MLVTDGPLEAMELFAANGWTDGLPVVPPTPDMLRAFLETVDQSQDEVLLAVEENRRSVTVELAAVNAVMAGCRPEMFPVVVAAVEGWADERWGRGDRTYFYSSNTSTGGSAPLALVNGPIRSQIGLNSGVNIYGPGTRANATIGRALRLILINALGFASGVLDNATQGHPGKFSFCIAENEEDSPWEPLHVERGFSASDSTVLTFAGRGPEAVDNRLASGGEAILYSIADTMSRLGSMMGLGGATLVVMGPEHAHTLSAQGWSKADVKRFLYDNFKRSFPDLQRAGFSPRSGTPRTIMVDGVEHLHGCRGPEDVIIVVAGGRNAGVSSVVSNWGYRIPLGDYVMTPVRNRPVR
jgi:hypothetical protein